MFSGFLTMPLCFVSSVVLLIMLSFRSSRRRYVIKKIFLKISQYSQENNCVGDRRFLWTMGNFSEHLFRRTSASGCSWSFKVLGWSLLSSEKAKKQQNIKPMLGMISTSALQHSQVKRIFKRLFYCRIKDKSKA